MGRENDVLQAEEGGILRGLLLEDVERRSGYLPALERCGQISLYDKLAARAVYDAYALLHGGQRGGVDDAGCLRREAYMEREVVGVPEKLVGAHQRDGVLARDGS